MNLALDTTPLYITTAGMARYVRGLLSGFSRISGEISGVIWPWAWEVENLAFTQPMRGFRTLYRECLWAPYLAGRELKRRKADRVHLTSTVMPDTGSLPVCQTLPDCSGIRYPERFRRWQRWRSPRWMASLCRADRILCISRFTADEAMTLLHLPADRIEVIHLGKDFGETSRILPEPPPFALPEEFLLFVGSLEPGKNLGLLRNLYERAAATGHSLPPLVILGARWPGVQTEGVPPASWIYAGRQPDGVLRWCYQRARALVFPSRYEGFGLPVLEAMAEGCPVLCGPVASLPEVGGDAVMYAPLDVESWGSALAELLRNESLRNDLIRRGRSRAQQFTWERCARETLSVYHRLRS